LVQKIFEKLRRYFRYRRYQMIRDITKVETVEGFVLDLGGGANSFFVDRFPKQEHVVLVDINYNTAHQAKERHPNLLVVVADGGQLPFAKKSIEIVISNSVIEHVNDPEKLAIEIQRVSKGYFLQTPNEKFPMETHSLIAIPFFNFVAKRWLKRSLCTIFGASFEYIESVHYLSEKRLKSLFPDSTLVYEKAFGLKKSFYIYKFDTD
jgi:ubiquinone/menaquinone biosynthesis C-methylase UbiE